MRLPFYLTPLLSIKPSIPALFSQFITAMVLHQRFIEKIWATKPIK
jgi:hypothetical protein